MATAPAAPAQPLNPQPQTTGKSPGLNSFIAYSFPGNVPQYATSYSGAGAGWGKTVTTALVGASGYYRRLRVKFTATGGVNGTTTVATAADAPFNAVSQVLLRDAASNVNIINLPGWETFKLLPLISGSHGLWKYADPEEAPFYQAPSVGTAGTGDFQFLGELPLEFGPEALGVISADNTSVQPALNMTFASDAAVYTTAPGTVPALNAQVDADFWWNPSDPSMLPNGLGSSRQWGLNVGTPGVSNGSSQLVSFPKPGGGQIESLTFVCRDSTGARTDTAWPSRVQLAVDNTTYLNIDLDELIQDGYIKFQFPSNSDPMYNGSSGVDVAGARPVGVLPISFRDSEFQVDTGLAQSGLTDISTTPGTSVQLGGTGWRNVDADANSPYTITLVAGLVVPAGTLVATQG